MTNSSPRRPETSRTWPPFRSSMTTSPPRTRRCGPFSIRTSPTSASTRGMGSIRSPRGSQRRPAILRRSAAPRGCSRSGEQEQRWREAEAEAKTSIETCTARLFALKNRDGYKDHEKLGLRRGQLEKEKRDLANEQARLARARANVADLSVEAARVADRLGEVGRAVDRHARRLAEAADRSGVSRDGSPADTGEDLPVTAKARAAARRDDIREVATILPTSATGTTDRRGELARYGPAVDGGLRDVLPRGR